MLKRTFLTGSVLLNLDSEEDDALTIGSAGGVDVEIDGTYELASISTEFTFFELIVKGLTGGHSGVDIHTGRSNAIKVLNRVLFELNKAFEIKIPFYQWRKFNECDSKRMPCGNCFKSR